MDYLFEDGREKPLDAGSCNYRNFGGDLIFSCELLKAEVNEVFSRCHHVIIIMSAMRTIKYGTSIFALHDPLLKLC